MSCKTYVNLLFLNQDQERNKGWFGWVLTTSKSHFWRKFMLVFNPEDKLLFWLDFNWNHFPMCKKSHKRGWKMLLKKKLLLFSIIRVCVCISNGLVIFSATIEFKWAAEFFKRNKIAYLLIEIALNSKLCLQGCESFKENVVKIWLLSHSLRVHIPKFLFTFFAYFAIFT